MFKDRQGNFILGEFDISSPLIMDEQNVKRNLEKSVGKMWIKEGNFKVFILLVTQLRY